jgi:hypothetical protein
MTLAKADRACAVPTLVPMGDMTVHDLRQNLQTRPTAVNFL